MENKYYMHGVTLLITHYNRSKSLEKLLKIFTVLQCSFEEIVVSDDGSKPEHQRKLEHLASTFNFRLIKSESNKGFANNMNKGQDAVKTPYTLYIQEDFEPSENCIPHLVDALNIMQAAPDLDYIRFWSFYKYPNLKPYGKGFSELVFSRWNMSHLKFFMYSDNPHLRRSNFLQKFGRYQEDIDGNISEYRMSVSFMQKKGKGLFYDDYESLFTHKNYQDEPSCFNRASWRSSNSPIFLFARWFYLRYKWLKSYKDLKLLRT